MKKRATKRPTKRATTKKGMGLAADTTVATILRKMDGKIDRVLDELDVLKHYVRLVVDPPKPPAHVGPESEMPGPPNLTDADITT